MNTGLIIIGKYREWAGLTLEELSELRRLKRYDRIVGEVEWLMESL
jgi:hypothetical protein